MSILTSFNQHFTSITSDSRKVTDGALFLAYPGAFSDGRDFIAQAIKSGAAAVVWEKNDFVWHSDWHVSNVAVDHLKHQVGRIAAEYYDFPSNKLTVIGVTGTNGKTSVTHWLAQCLTLLGKKAAVLGTIGNGFAGEFPSNQLNAMTEAVNTTPDAILLQKMLASFLEQHADAVVMEVSSHGLDQGRVNGVRFDVAVLTNLSRDHLDYHESMIEYAAAKQKLFNSGELEMAILNADDVFGQEIINSIEADTHNVQAKSCMSYGLSSGEIRGSHLKLNDAGLSMQVTTPQGVALLTAPVLGRFNAYNVLAVLATMLALDVGLNDAISAISKIRPVPGRMQQFGGGSLPLVIVDYAHTPDALEKVLITLREQADSEQKQIKLICVFGCGGDRDAGKRPLMGALASKLADFVVVTSDNPRSENPLVIIQDIVKGMSSGYLVEPDRANAIYKAVESAGQGDIVLVAGKGHENYQEISGVRTPFSDVAVVQDALNKYKAVDLSRALQ